MRGLDSVAVCTRNPKEAGDGWMARMWCGVVLCVGISFLRSELRSNYGQTGRCTLSEGLTRLASMEKAVNLVNGIRSSLWNEKDPENRSVSLLVITSDRFFRPQLRDKHTNGRLGRSRQSPPT
jgi:hypothetical protein